jgi:hypothetical protein
MTRRLRQKFLDQAEGQSATVLFWANHVNGNREEIIIRSQSATVLFLANHIDETREESIIRRQSRCFELVISSNPTEREPYLNIIKQQPTVSVLHLNSHCLVNAHGLADFKTFHRSLSLVQPCGSPYILNSLVSFQKLNPNPGTRRFSRSQQFAYCY